MIPAFLQGKDDSLELSAKRDYTVSTEAIRKSTDPELKVKELMAIVCRHASGLWEITRSD